MKIRNGFVSNSSSASYLVTMPTGINVNIIDLSHPNIQKAITEEETSEPSVREDLRELVSTGYLYPDDASAFGPVTELFYVRKWIIKEIDTGPDEGHIIYIKMEDITSKLHEIEVST